MDWTLAITRNRDALKPIIAALCAKAGLKSGAVPAARKNRLSPSLRLPHHLISAILLVLRPAESAVRRLIVILAALKQAAHQTSALPLIRSFGPPSPRMLRVEGEAGDVMQQELGNSEILQNRENASKSMRLSPFPRLLWGEGAQRADEGERQFPAIIITSNNASLPSSAPAFALFDPLKSFDPDSTWNLDEANESGFRSGRGTDPTSGWHILPDSDEQLPAHSILRRLAAIRRALDTLPHQARRLLRYNARRDAQLKKPFTKPIRLFPMRPGFPPGWRHRSIHEIDPILKECHLLANDLLCDTG